MRRSSESLATVASLDNLTLAFSLAARGKAGRPEVVAFRARLEAELGQLAEELRRETYVSSPLTEFTIHDPKTRRIQAPIFRDRVVHHALISRIGPVIDRSLVDDSFACRLGKGTAAAVERAEEHLRRARWYAKMDVRSYFPSIDHERLLAQLRGRLKSQGVLRLCARLLATYAGSPGRGLPIGALTSQYFANLYLNPLDRLLLEGIGSRGYARFMDDLVVWGDSREFCWLAIERAKELAGSELGLQLHRIQVQRSERGLTFLGYRLDGSSRRPTLRRGRRYRQARARWERAHGMGLIDAAALQRGYSAALAILEGCRSRGVRGRDLGRCPPLDA